jgi:predicted NUDIX family NTP pyrophosphohydrolase
MYRISRGNLEVLLAHPGGPFWKNKDNGAWVVPRGNVEENEDIFDAAKREFSEETGLTASEPFVALGEVKHRSAKHVHVWAFQGDCDPRNIRSNTFEMEWPPKSGKRQSFPEIDKAAFFNLADAKAKILASESPFLDRLADKFPDLVGKTSEPSSDLGTLFG